MFVFRVYIGIMLSFSASWINIGGDYTSELHSPSAITQMLKHVIVQILWICLSWGKKSSMSKKNQISVLILYIIYGMYTV